MAYTFTDFYHNEVRLSFEKEPFSKAPKHVWVICRYQDQWLLTKHRSRGIEFPGGKVEVGETALQAAHREVLEETGAVLAEIHYLAQYRVDGKGATIIKNVYYGIVDHLTKPPHYYETEGPVLLEELPDNIKDDPSYSFMMKDEVLPKTLQYIARHF